MESREILDQWAVHNRICCPTVGSRGILVVQLDEDYAHFGTPLEGRSEASAYEGAIDYLDSRGLIGRARIGIIGFSRTGLGVKYALTHSKYHFAAATVAEGSDVGYFRYFAYLNSTPWQTADAEGVNGGPPFRKALTQWFDTVPSFNLDAVSTPLRLETNDPESLFFSWEWFAGLTRLRRPIELIFIPDGIHQLVRPWERLTSQQGNVDWFCFWLKDEQDPDATKAEQYTRWRKLRELEKQDGLTSKATISSASN